MSAIFSPDGKHRYRLDRSIQEHGFVFAYFGVNGSTAGPEREDHTTRKWNEFTRLHGGSRYIVGNPFAHVATDVRQLSIAVDPVGPENPQYLRAIIAEADILVPCWGNRHKVPRALHHHIATLRDQIFQSGKPVLIFGLTQDGDPKHPLTLPYSTRLQVWTK